MQIFQAMLTKVVTALLQKKSVVQMLLCGGFPILRRRNFSALPNAWRLGFLAKILDNLG